MFVKRDDIKYMLHDFLEVRYGLDKLENTRIVQFLMERTGFGRRFVLTPASGFLANGILLNVVSMPGCLRVRECLTLNQKTREIVHFQRMNSMQRLTC